ncbi:tRNA-uridine aminocarboxypropyltransferase [Photobacterium sp. 53610]|uniref:tRNA-uridine aminocarboxypropyltransferase n=1 Tax=Photobacterium sp. 53610 TaxID=3102789 RepID=UPI002ED7D65D
MRIESPDTCARCGFRYNCICHAEPKLRCQARFVLLTHSKEFDKDSNTGVLMARSLPDCQRICWSRTEPPHDLLRQIADPQVQPWLLFPADDHHPATDYHPITDKTPLFILLDATWQEARKMVRKSPWLAALPRLSLTPDQLSAYALRRNQQSGNLCTCETGIALLNLLEAHEDARALQHYFETFLHIFHAEKSGHTR